MSQQTRTYLEHVAIRVRDIQWHVRFFGEALGMPIREIDGPPDDPKQVWLLGGIQLISDPAFAGPEGRFAHLGIMTSDLEATICEVHKWGVTTLSQGHNWVALPDGLAIELIQAREDTVAEILAINPRA